MFRLPVRMYTIQNAVFNQKPVEKKKKKRVPVIKIELKSHPMLRKGNNNVAIESCLKKKIIDPT